MWDYFESMLQDLYRSSGHLGREQWIAVFVGALIVGAFFLRGFGLKSG